MYGDFTVAKDIGLAPFVLPKSKSFTLKTIGLSLVFPYRLSLLGFYPNIW